MKAYKLAAADRGLLKNSEFTGYALFNHGQKDTVRPDNFGPLYVFNDDTLYPGNGLGMHPHANVDIVTIMISGEESHKDTLGIHENYKTGDVQLISAGSGLHHAGGNTSNDADARHLQIWIAPTKTNTTPYVRVLKSSEKSSSDAKLTTIVAKEFIEGALRIEQDIWISELKLQVDDTYPISARNPKSGLLIYVMSGDIIVKDNQLLPGDTLFVTEWSALELIVKQENAYLILIETTIA
ncbi:MAG: pirin family protein [Mucilaginibacter sp.]